MYRFLLTPRWLRIHLAVIILVPAFAWLGNWQRDLFVEHRSGNEAISHNLDAAPVPLADLVPVPGSPVTSAIRYRRVTVTGVFDTGHQWLARQRNNDNGTDNNDGMGAGGGAIGYDVLTPLVTADGTAVLVNRGWVGQGTTPATSAPIPAPPTGRVTVTGRLQPPELPGGDRRDNLDVPTGQTQLIDTPRLAQQLPYPLYTGFVELIAVSPSVASAPVPVAPPQGTSTTIYLVYVIQWWLFIVLTLGFWVMLVRREAADLRRAAAGTGPGGPQRQEAEATGTANPPEPIRGGGASRATASPGRIDNRPRVAAASLTAPDDSPGTRDGTTDEHSVARSR